MYLDNSPSVVECESDQCDSISLITASSSSIITLSSSSVCASPLSAYEFTAERITRLLKRESSKYKVIKNSKNNLSSECWQIFGLPAKKYETKEEFEPIPGFVSCQSCYQTYAFTSSSGTRVLNSHSCVQKLSNRKRSSSASADSNGTQLKLGSVMKCYKQVQLPDKEITLIKDLTCKWLCQDMRAFLW
jgi:hypothetical protein